MRKTFLPGIDANPLRMRWCGAWNSRFHRMGAVALLLLSAAGQGCGDIGGSSGGDAATPSHATASADGEKRAAIDSMYEGYRDAFADVAEISADALVVLQEEKTVVIVDVREPKERQVSVIPGAITKDEFKDGTALKGDSAIVVYCTIGYRSGVYVKKLEKKGVRAYNLKGGILSWVHAGQGVVDEQGAVTKRVHVYGEEWNLLPEGFEGVW